RPPGRRVRGDAAPARRDRQHDRPRGADHVRRVPPPAWRAAPAHAGAARVGAARPATAADRPPETRAAARRPGQPRPRRARTGGPRTDRRRRARLPPPGRLTPELWNRRTFNGPLNLVTSEPRHDHAPLRTNDAIARRLAHRSTHRGAP